MLGETYRPDQKIPEATAKRFLNNEQVKQFSDSALMQVMQDLKIDVPYVVKKRRQILNKALREKQLQAANVALDKLENHLGLNTKVRVTETRQINSNLQDNYDKAVKESKKVTVETEISQPQNNGQNDTQESEKRE